MASYGQSINVEYYAYNTSTGAYVTGDVANHTLKLVKNGTAASPANAASEVDATNTPGLYTLVITGTEAQNNTVTIAGKSSAANVILVGKTYTFEQIPTAAPGIINGLPILGANTASLSFTGLTTNILGNLVGTVSTLTTYTGNTPQTGDAYARLGAPAGASTAADIAAVKTDTAAVKTQTDKLTFTVTNQIDANVLDWKSATAPAMTGDAFARIGAAGIGLTAVALTATQTFNNTGTWTGNLVGTVSTLTTYTGNTPQTGDVFATANAEPSSVIASNASLASKIGWLAAQSLNKITQSATTMTLRNNLDSGTIATSATSDDGTTATRGVFA